MCNFKTVNKNTLKKHKTKQHKSPSSSDSPVKKKPKISKELSVAIFKELIDKIHDRNETEEETDKELQKLELVNYEENKVDQQVMDDKVQEKILSDQQDAKILSQNKKPEEARLEEIAQSAKAEQTMKRPKRKRSITAPKPKTESVKNVKLPPGFKDIPEKLKKHFPRDHVILCTEPNGLCGVSCGSAHIFAQPKEGENFRKEINKYMVSHWEFFKDKIPFPYERQVEAQGERVKFSDPWAFQNFLQTQLLIGCGQIVKKSI